MPHEVSTWAVGETEDDYLFLKKISDRVVNIFAERALQAGQAGTASHPITAAQIRAKACSRVTELDRPGPKTGAGQQRNPTARARARGP